MKYNFIPLLAVLALRLLSTPTASAHPASGIVVDPQGQVFFIFSSHGIYKLDTQRKLTCVHPSRGGHWMCLDAQGSFSRTQPKHFERVTPDGVKPAVIFADGGSPIAVVRDGSLFYASNDERLTPGGMHVTRNSPAGELAIFTPGLGAVTESLGVTGLAPGPEGDLYVACPAAVFRLKKDGTFTTVVDPVLLKDCDVDYPDGNPNMRLPSLRGLAVDKRGAIFAAGTGCHCVVKITPDGKTETLLKVDRPWSPTGIAEHQGDLYILEYTNANGSPTEGWLPRVRKRSAGGKVTTLVTIDANGTATVTP